ncbi:MFS general substrate transporter [Lophiostoma macrostomum CBS 122681]|uniref:MFS general substrate transporter n=1 Tax=Lophiostoma macrostomum CBS 122681 TaxID=1314788 RepID=A0A6A6THI0_9PLEO|nr:MFS general substrate transporter [Lophiostoma macrostomum CBS 122681]
MDGDLVKDNESLLHEAQRNATVAQTAADLKEADIVDFDGPDDRQNPQNWSSVYKWSIVILISVLSLIVNLAILLCAPATSYILQEFHSTDKLESTLLVSIWELGEVVGPLIISPLAESFGRLPVYHAANICWILLTIAAAESTSMGMLIAMRFLLGLTVASTTLNVPIIGDLFAEQQHGIASGINTAIPFIAPCIGPTIGGFVAEAKGWRWTFWICALIAGPLQILFLILYRETYKVRILELKAAKLRKETGNQRLRSKYASKYSPSVTMRKAITRPLGMLFRCAVVGLVGLCSAIGMSLVYVIITTISEVYVGTYHFKQQLVGLTYISLGIGMSLSAVTIGSFQDRYFRSKKGTARPEHRIPPMLLGTILIPCGIVAFGWSVQYKLHWFVPMIWSAIVGYGYVSIAIAAYTYLLGAFPIYSTSATAGTVVIRNAAAASLPLAGPALREKIGIGWGFSVLALLVVLTIPIPLVLMRFGERLRKAQRYPYDHADQDQSLQSEVTTSPPEARR